MSPPNIARKLASILSFQPTTGACRIISQLTTMMEKKMNGDEWFTWLLFVAWITIIVAFIAEIVGVI